MRAGLCAVAIAALATACASTTAKPSGAPSPSISPSATSSAASSPTPSSPAPTPTPTSTPTPTPATIHGARVAEVSSAGGSGLFGSLGYQPPEIAVYADGSVVLGADTWFRLAPADLATLQSGLQTDLAGQPAVLGTPKGGSADTVLGVRRADGGYQTVRAGTLSQGVAAGAVPAPVVAAYTALEAVKTSAAAKTGSPYMGNAVRLAYDCPTTTRLAPKFWPDGLPAPTHTRGTTDCPETVTVSGSGADIARDACLDYDSALKSDADTQEVPYLAEGNKGIRTCVWRWALPDEQTR